MREPAFTARLSEWPGPEYHVRARFRAPLEYVYRWCTDYTSDDPSLEGEKFARKVLLLRRDRAVFEDLQENNDGWSWSRSEVTFHPPRGWSLQRRGNRVEVAATYLLTERPDRTVQLDCRWRRRARVPGPRISKAARERDSTTGWRHFARALERDYRREHPARGRSR